MTTALISANIGQFDTTKLVQKQSVDCDLYQFETLPVPMPNMNNRLRGKFIKLQSHRIDVLAKYDNHIWIDGSVQIKSEKFVEMMLMQLHRNGEHMVIGKHNLRSCIYEEIDFVSREMNDGNQYLLKRYSQEPLLDWRVYADQQGHPANWGLWSCGIFARRTSELVNHAFDDWFSRCIQFANFDQISFPFIVRNWNLKINTIEWNTIFDNEWFQLQNHNP